MREILITAFEPFGGKKTNRSEEVLRLLPDGIGGCAVRKALLPVVFGKAAEQALREPADAVFMLGEAGGRPAKRSLRTVRKLSAPRFPCGASLPGCGRKDTGQRFRKTRAPMSATIHITEWACGRGRRRSLSTARRRRAARTSARRQCGGSSRSRWRNGRRNRPENAEKTQRKQTVY